MEQIAIKQAMKSSFGRAPTGAVLYRGSKIIGTGYNRVGRHQGRIKTSSWSGSIHAEVDCILDALRRKQDVAGADMVVVRLNKKGELRLSYPCDSCFEVLQKFKIRRIVFSTTNGLSEIRV